MEYFALFYIVFRTTVVSIFPVNSFNVGINIACIEKKHGNRNNRKKQLEIRRDKSIHRTAGGGHFTNNAKTRTDIKKKNVKINRTKYTLKESHSGEAGTRSKGGRAWWWGDGCAETAEKQFCNDRNAPVLPPPPSVHVFSPFIRQTYPGVYE